VKAFGQEGRVDGSVDVLDPRVGHDRDRWSRVERNELLASFDENAAGGRGIEARSDGWFANSFGWFRGEP
jgi:hypothetical protein